MVDPRLVLIDAILESGACRTRHDARCLLTAGAVRLPGRKLTGKDAERPLSEFVGQELKIGKNRSILLGPPAVGD